jgi:AraC-like DNA-binding protein
MSESAFHLHFRKITSYSPLQYLKGVRLNKARQSIQGGGTTVNEVARIVGYERASQFSREYKRYFGRAPSDDLPGRGNTLKGVDYRAVLGKAV